MRTTIQSLQNLVAISLAMLIAILDFGEILLETLLRGMGIFSLIFSRSNTIGHISGMVGPIDMKQKGGALVEYWINNVAMSLDLTHDLDLGFFKNLK